MTESQRRCLRIAMAVAGALALVTAAVALVGHFGSAFLSVRSTDEAGPATVAVPSVKAGGDASIMSLHDTAQPVPDLRFQDGDGRSLTLADFRGKVVLLNLWATWCAPCRREMPTLDRLQARLGGSDFELVALSIDRAGIGVVNQFYAEIGVEHLARYIDKSGRAAGQLKVVGLPTTLLIDRAGREIARHVGPAEWDTPEMVNFLRRHLARQTSALPAPARIPENQQR